MIAHSSTYLVFGVIMSSLFNYRRLFELETIRDFMRPMSSQFVIAGPFLQPLRGLILAIGLWPLRRFLLEHKRGWLILWGIFVVFGILATPGAAPCSMEGIIYSKLPLWYHLIGLPEIALQTLAFSAILLSWERRAARTSLVPPELSHSVLADLVRALMTACFAWIGYAVGGLLSVVLVRLSRPDFTVDMRKAAGDIKVQMMFVVAFAVNLVAVFAVGRWSRARPVPFGLAFSLFWAVDTLVPWLYQLMFTHPSPVHLALLLGLFPALIIAVSLPLNYRRVVQPK